MAECALLNATAETAQIMIIILVSYSVLTVFYRGAKAVFREKQRLFQRRSSGRSRNKWSKGHQTHQRLRLIEFWLQKEILRMIQIRSKLQ